jgi:hypothetical protein
MKPLFILLLLSTFFSCQTSQKKEQSLDPILTKQNESTVPEFIKNYLAIKLRGWKLAPKESWDDSTFNKYQTDSSQINYFLSDINCDTKPDFVAILKDSLGNFSAFKISSNDQYYFYDELEKYDKKEKLDIGIRFLRPGATFERYDGSLQRFDCGAIERFFVDGDSKKIFFIDEIGISAVIQKDE